MGILALIHSGFMVADKVEIAVGPEGKDEKKAVHWSCQGDPSLK